MNANGVEVIPDWQRTYAQTARIPSNISIDRRENQMDEYKGHASYVRRLGQWHLMATNGKTLCGKAMLSYNHAKNIPIEERRKCGVCFHYADMIEDVGK